MGRGVKGITFSIDPARGRVQMTIGTEFTTEDVISAMRAVIHSPALPDGFTAVSDHTGVQRPLNQSQLFELVSLMEQHAHRFAGGRWAIISTRPASYGMMRLLAARAQLALRMRVRIFFDVQRAAQWLDADPSRSTQDAPARG